MSWVVGKAASFVSQIKKLGYLLVNAQLLLQNKVSVKYLACT